MHFPCSPRHRPLIGCNRGAFTAGAYTAGTTRMRTPRYRTLRVATRSYATLLARYPGHHPILLDVYSAFNSSHGRHPVQTILQMRVLIHSGGCDTGVSLRQIVTRIWHVNGQAQRYQSRQRELESEQMNRASRICFIVSCISSLIFGALKIGNLFAIRVFCP
jgi:hypothetical protein